MSGCECNWMINESCQQCAYDKANMHKSEALSHENAALRKEVERLKATRPPMDVVAEQLAAKDKRIAALEKAGDAMRTCLDREGLEQMCSECPIREGIDCDMTAYEVGPITLWDKAKGGE